MESKLNAELKIDLFRRFNAVFGWLYMQVRHLELRREKEVERSGLVRFLAEAISTQFRNPAVWN